MHKFILLTGIFLLTFPLCSSTATLVFSDDFESYNIGDDIAINPTWINVDPDTCGLFLVESDGNDKAIWGDFSQAEIVTNECYYMVGIYKTLSDCFARVDCKIEDGPLCMAYLTLRLSGDYPSDWECYNASLITGFGKALAILEIDYVHNGTLDTLNSLDVPGFDLNSWHTMEFAVTGDSVVNLTITLDGETHLNAQDNPGRISFGEASLGLYCSTVDGSPNFMLDNYGLYSIDATIQPQSLGKVKCLYR